MKQNGLYTVVSKFDQFCFSILIFQSNYLTSVTLKESLKCTLNRNLKSAPLKPTFIVTKMKTPLLERLDCQICAFAAMP
jgi:hypothetical protein